MGTMVRRVTVQDTICPTCVIKPVEGCTVPVEEYGAKVEGQWQYNDINGTDNNGENVVGCHMEAGFPFSDEGVSCTDTLDGKLDFTGIIPGNGKPDHQNNGKDDELASTYFEEVGGAVEGGKKSRGGGSVKVTNSNGDTVAFADIPNKIGQYVITYRVRDDAGNWNDGKVQDPEDNFEVEYSDTVYRTKESDCPNLTQDCSHYECKHRDGSTLVDKKYSDSVVAEYEYKRTIIVVDTLRPVIGLKKNIHDRTIFHSGSTNDKVNEKLVGDGDPGHRRKHFGLNEPNLNEKQYEQFHHDNYNNPVNPNNGAHQDILLQSPLANGADGLGVPTRSETHLLYAGNQGNGKSSVVSHNRDYQNHDDHDHTFQNDGGYDHLKQSGFMAEQTTTSTYNGWSIVAAASLFSGVAIMAYGLIKRKETVTSVPV